MIEDRALKILKKNPLSIPSIIFSKIICVFRSYYFTRMIDDGGGRIVITKPFLKFKLKKHKDAYISIKGDFRVIPHVGGNTNSFISMGKNSKLIIGGDFIIGQGVRISIGSNAELSFGGKEKESDSGITSDTLIMVSKKVQIGKDFICAWNNFISDSDWHSIEGQNHQKDVTIGDHVWVANSVNILKGTTIGNNCIIASNSKIINNNYHNDTLVAGIPGKVIKRGVNWSRDLKS